MGDGTDFIGFITIITAIVITIAIILGFLVVHTLGIFGIGPGEASMIDYLIVGLTIGIILLLIQIRIEIEINS